MRACYECSRMEGFAAKAAPAACAAWWHFEALNKNKAMSMTE